MSDRRALVLGGAGFISSHLCEALLAACVEVVCVDNFCTGRRINLAHLDGSPGLCVIDHDVTRPSSRCPSLLAASCASS